MTLDKDHVALPLTVTLFVTSFAAYWIGTAPNNILPLEISAFIEHFKLSETVAGTMAAVESLFVVVATFLLAKRAQYLPTVKVAMAGSLIALLANFATLYVEPDEMLWLARIASGVGFGIILAVANVIISQSANPDRVYALIWAIAAVLDTLLFLVAPFFIEEFGYPGLFIFVNILIIACAVLMFWLPQALPISDQENADAEGNRVAGLILVGTVFILFSALGGLWSFGEQIMANTFDMDARQRGYVLALAVLAGFAGSVIAGVVADKLDRRLLLFSGLIVAVGLSVVATQTEHSLMFKVAFIVFVGTVYFLIPVLLGLAASLAASGEYAVMVSSMIVLGTAIGPMAGGALVEFYGYSALGGYFLLSGAVTAIAMIIVFMRRHSTQELECQETF